MIINTPRSNHIWKYTLYMCYLLTALTADSHQCDIIPKTLTGSFWLCSIRPLQITIYWASVQSWHRHESLISTRQVSEYNNSFTKMHLLGFFIYFSQFDGAFSDFRRFPWEAHQLLAFVLFTSHEPATTVNCSIL